MDKDVSPTAVDHRAVFTAVWREFSITPDERTVIVERYESLCRCGCSQQVALRTALDDWSNRCVNAERRFGFSSSYRRGLHWERMQILSRLLAGDRCEADGCSRGWSLDTHHHHYESVGWESLFALSVVCRECHRKLTQGGAYIERQLLARREEEQSERDHALVTLGEEPLADGASLLIAPDLIT